MAKDKNKKASEVVDISKSKAKREERRKEVAKDKRKRMISRVVSIVILVAIAGVIIFFAGKSIYLAAIRTTPSTDMSAGLTADGKIDGINVSDALTLVDYENITISDEDVSTEEQVQGDIDELLEQYQEIDYDISLEVADGDMVNIDYVGTIDGVEFEGGNSNNAGYDLTIGSGSFIDDFEQQLIGSHPGDDVTVEVTFPEDYTDETVAGKDAVFAVTVNGIYKEPTFDDAFLANNGLLTDEITNVDEYRASIAKNYYEENLRTFLSSYIVENSTVNSYPKDYVKITKATTKANDEATLSYYSQVFSSSNMNIWDMTGDENELAYEKSLSERAQDAVKEAMVYQAIFEKAGLTIDMEAVKAEMNETNGDETYADSMIESYGEGYFAQSEMKEAVMDYLVDLYKDESKMPEDEPEESLEEQLEQLEQSETAADTSAE